jgi:RecA-family ATPase
MDRASGSGVFARDPDALLDLLELELPESVVKQEQNKAVCTVCAQYLERYISNWQQRVSQDDCLNQAAMQETCQALLPGEALTCLQSDIETAQVNAKKQTAWRIEGTLREYPRFDPVNLWFNYPIHRVDDIGSLSDIRTDLTPWEKGLKSTQASNARRKKKSADDLENAIKFSTFDGQAPTTKDVAEYMGITQDSVSRKIRKNNKYQIDKDTGTIVLKEAQPTGSKNHEPA